MVDGFGWRSIYYVMGALSLLSLFLAVFQLKEETMRSESILDIPSVFLSTLGFGGILTAATDQGNYGIASILTWFPLLMGSICLILFADSADLSKAFQEIEELATQCKFRDCTHTSEPGCAILAAVADGRTDNRRLASYLKLRQEAGYEGLSILSSP